MGVPAGAIDLIPPIGASAGLPFTIVWADDITDTGGAATSGYALFDSSLWADRLTTNRPQSPVAWGGATTTTVRQTLLNPSQIHFLGLTLANTPPALNFGTGSLENGQAIQDVGRGLHSSGHQKCFYPASKTTVSDAGRTVSYARTGYASPRAGNHTWQIHKTQTDRLMPSYDLQIGSQLAINSIGDMQAITHMSKADLPSNGIGESYGDRHHTTLLSSLWSAPIQYTTGTGLETGSELNGDMKEFAAHWGINLMVEHPVLTGGKSISATDATNNAAGHSLNDQDSLNLPAETIQTPMVSDKHNDKTNFNQGEHLFPLGRTDLGNHMVADTCGLIGYEGVFVATAFLSVSRSSNPPNAQAPPASPLVPDRQWNEDGAGMFAGINIQVHSGTTYRRNGLSYSIGAEQLFKYGSDGSFTEPMTEGMTTTGLRTGYKGETFPTQANETRFHTGRVNHVSNGSQANNLGNAFSVANINGSALPSLQSRSKKAARYILGQHGQDASNVQWQATETISQHFMKDKIPTKVRVVPVLVDTVDTVVQAGSSHPSSASITFKKPTVDYHVIISLSPKTRINATVDLDATEYGTPTNRNFPQSKRLTANMDLEDEACQIYHAIFRIDPTLDRVYFDSTATSAIASQGALSLDNEMTKSVMPKGDAEGEGWNLHQLTPFRPIANVSWSQVPLFCAAIEAGGFYQRGGISHLWDADAYGEELFVGADIIDANHFNAETWGTGQVWADGVGDLAYPRGSELMIFKYNPTLDPFYTRIATSVTNNPLYRAATTGIQGDYINLPRFQNNEILELTESLLPRLKQYEGWSIHDWVFPQIELMRYLGREDKANARHPRHSQNTGNTPIYHPTLHCSSLRFMQDGKMAMAAIHRDYIGSEEEYPDADIAYPFNPDSGSGSGCPAGYYRSGSQCIPIVAGDNPNSEGQHLDPITGEVIPSPPPAPTNGSGSGHQGGGDNFDLLPSWGRIVANTSGRSLILLWSEIPAENGKAVAGRRMFDAKKIRVDGSDYYTQNWTQKDSWWSGSRISYWYSESGQRAIPMTYGSYPEVRCSYANLPRALPHLYTSGIRHGYPTQQPVNQVGATLTGVGLDSWAQGRAGFLHNRVIFVPTTIGFADYGPAANPHQELGWSGWSFPRGLYDPIGYGNNTQFFSDAPESLNVSNGIAITPSSQGQWSGFCLGGASFAGFDLMKGPMSAFSHHGPLHYGITTTHHPFKPTRTWKQVHGGVGYDVPIHLLAPAEVSVRARQGGRNSLDLEMETPFHRTDTQHLEAGTTLNSGFDLGGKSNPAATRTPLGQYYLRTNLWDDASRTQGSNAKIGGLQSIGKDLGRGPIVSGNGLFAFWNDHPTEHFHAGAVPLMPSKDYDISVIENERYAPMILGRIDEINDVDYVAVAEQLQSSVDVHVSSVSRPMWDSGSIVSGRGTGARDVATSNNTRVSQNRSEMSGEILKTSDESQATPDLGFGKGQRILRTDDGTLHSFCIERSATGTGGNRPIFVHYTKPLHNDLFWNRKAMRVNPSNAEYTGLDEVGPEIGATDVLRSAAFASDSLGTIHAVIEVSQASRSPKHTLYYGYAKRTLENYNPSPVYRWSWSVAPAVIPNHGTDYDLRQPTLVCDANDRLHLACRMVVTGKPSHIIYSTKLPSETNFIGLPTYNDDPANWTDDRWSKVNQTSTNNASSNSASSTNHGVSDCDAPKICLIGDNTPLVFYRGACKAVGDDALFGNRANDAVYVNIGRNDTGAFDPSGRYRFDPLKAIHVVGVQNAFQYHADKVIYYDVVVDERDRAYVTIIKNDNGRRTLINTFDAAMPFADQYTTADGLGVTKYLFIPKNSTVRPDYKHITTTVNGQGQMHMILAFTLEGQDDDRGIGGLYRDGVTEATQAPFQWANSPAGDANSATPSARMAGAGGYDKPNSANTSFDWPDGGTFLQPTTGQVTHFMEVWMPTFEFDMPDSVLRSINIRWLSVPSMNYDSTNGWHPVGSAQSMNGHEDFTHTNPQLRYQRFWGFDAGELDLKWATNELSWMNTFHRGSDLYYPYLGGSFTTVGEGDTDGVGIAGWPI